MNQHLVIVIVMGSIMAAGLVLVLRDGIIQTVAAINRVADEIKRWNDSL